MPIGKPWFESTDLMVPRSIAAWDVHCASDRVLQCSSQHLPGCQFWGSTKTGHLTSILINFERKIFVFTLLVKWVRISILWGMSWCVSPSSWLARWSFNQNPSKSSHTNLPTRSLGKTSLKNPFTRTLWKNSIKFSCENILQKLNLKMSNPSSRTYATSTTFGNSCVSLMSRLQWDLRFCNVFFTSIVLARKTTPESPQVLHLPRKWHQGSLSAVKVSYDDSIKNWRLR